MAMGFSWTSLTLRICFKLFEHGLEVFYLNGDSFKDPENMIKERDGQRSA